MWLLVVYILTILSSLRADDNEVVDIMDLYTLSASGKMKVIIDTDGGVDDAMAILMGLACHDIHIVAITTTAGNTNLEQVIMNVHKTLRVARMTIPVHPGADKPFVPNPDVNTYEYGTDGFGDVPYPYPPSTQEAQSEHAVSAMVRIISQNHKEISIIALGPLTNIALAIQLNPLFKQSVKSIFWSGGSIYGFGNKKGGREFNAHYDPVAAHICFSESGPPIIMVPWETATLKTTVSIHWRRNVLGVIDTPQIKFFNVIENASLSSGKWFVRDAKTMAAVINHRAIKRVNTYYVEPIWEGESTRGLTLVDYNKLSGKPPNAIIIEDISVDAFMNIVKHYLSINLNELTVPYK